MTIRRYGLGLAYVATTAAAVAADAVTGSAPRPRLVAGIEAVPIALVGAAVPFAVLAGLRARQGSPSGGSINRTPSVSSPARFTVRSTGTTSSCVTAVSCPIRSVT